MTTEVADGQMAHGMVTHEPIFLTSAWRHLLMLNFEIEARCLERYIPAGTELDFFRGRTFVSLVGFRFLDTRLKGWQIPGHRNFDEVNLRFYVRRPHFDGARRGVVFIKEIVPRFWIRTIANLVYHENYVSRVMRHDLNLDGSLLRVGSPVEYAWRSAGRWHRIGARITGEPVVPSPHSEEQFITEHYWGYSKSRAGTTVEYEVAHPPWRVYPVSEPRCDIDIANIYGEEFVSALSAPPSSAFVADGSAVSVHRGTRITDDAMESERDHPEDGEPEVGWAAT